MPALHNAEFRKTNAAYLHYGNPFHCDIDMHRTVKSHRLRDGYIEEFGYAVLTEEAVEALLTFGP